MITHESTTDHLTDRRLDERTSRLINQPTETPYAATGVQWIFTQSQIWGLFTTADYFNFYKLFNFDKLLINVQYSRLSGQVLPN